MNSKVDRYYIPAGGVNVALGTLGYANIINHLINSNEESLRRIAILAGKKATFYRVDLLDREGLNAVFETESIDAVIHFAALKSVGESVAQPLRYYHNNITGTLHLLEVMNAHDVRRFVFSSSATVYGRRGHGRRGNWSKSGLRRALYASRPSRASSEP